MLTLYIANKNYSSWSLRPWVLLRELGVELTEKLVSFDADPAAGSFRKFSPTGKVPCLIDGPRVVWDSLAIVEYVAESVAERVMEATQSVWPLDRDARAFARCAAAEMHSGFFDLRAACSMNCGLRIRLASVTPGLSADIARLDELWNEGLTRFGGPFLAGREFTAADAFYAPVAFRVQTYGLALSAAAQDYVDRLLNLPSMREWYASALTEKWRDEAHELDARNAGEWLHDYRAAGV